MFKTTAIDTLKQDKKCQACSTSFCQPCLEVHQLILSRQNIASAKIKTDKLDAVKLANLLRGGYIAECYVPDRRKMDLRVRRS